jgi:hypothetical protein
VSKRPARAAGLIILTLLCPAFAAMGLGGQDKGGEPPPERETPEAGAPQSAAENAETPPVRVRASGRVRLVGTGIFPELVITGEDREWYIDKNEASKLRDFQQQTVTVEGTETYLELRFANGLSAGRRYSLKDITITGKEP